jgi:hypothetical protein
MGVKLSARISIESWLVASHQPLATTRRFLVRKRPRRAIVAAILLAVVITGCGGDDARPVDLSKGTDTSQFKGMMDQMKANLKADKSGKPIPGK